MNELEFVAKYGPVGLLAILMIGGGKMGLKVVDRFYVLADKIERMLDLHLQTTLTNEASAEKRHSDTRLFIAESDKETRHAIRNDINNLSLVVSARIAHLDDAISGRRRKSDVDPEANQ